MYVRKILFCENPTVDSPEKINPFCDCVRLARPLSYYVKGGVDTDGYADRVGPPEHYDTPDESGVLDGTVDASTDSRVSRLDIVDMASQMATESALRASKEITDIKPSDGK